MDLNGLSADQAPPISAPAMFFLTAPIFGIIAGLLILFSDVSILSNRYSIDSILITHVLTIGFLSFSMLGSLTQMLPVLAGIKIPKVGLFSKMSYIFLLIGTLIMIFGMLNDSSNLTLISSIFLTIGFLVILIPIFIGFKEVTNITASVRALITSLVFALTTILLGFYLLISYSTDTFSSIHLALTNIHSVWAVFGFAGILIIGVSFHVLPMFYVAPRFKNFCKQNVVWLISISLLLWAIFNIFFDVYSIIAKISVAMFFWAFATAIYVKLNQRRRPVSDVTVWYWRSASIFMTLGAFSWVIDDFFGGEHITIVSILIGGGFIFSLIIGMLYKILPFLVWFHLNAKGYMSIPTINEMINKKLARTQFILFIISLIGFIISFFIPSLLTFFAITFILSMIILEYNVIAPILIYKRIIKTKPDFDMSTFNMPIKGI
jgi:hypothetical protein